MFSMVLSDSLFSNMSDKLPSAHFCGTKLHHLDVEGRKLHACMCVASGAALIMPWEGRRFSTCAIGKAVRSLRGGEPTLRRQVLADPVVRIVVISGRRSTTTCRGKNERFPKIIKDRKESLVIQDVETPWTVCDFEDVVKQRRGRRVFKELESSKLRHPDGLYGEPGDEYHFRSDIGYQTGEELIKCAQRTGLARYGNELAHGHGMLLIIAAGWNTETESFSRPNKNGDAWRKAELVALAELCALDGQPLSEMLRKMRELLRRAALPSHRSFCNQPIKDIVSASESGSSDSGSQEESGQGEDRADEWRRVRNSKRKRQGGSFLI